MIKKLKLNGNRVINYSIFFVLLFFLVEIKGINKIKAEINKIYFWLKDLIIIKYNMYAIYCITIKTIIIINTVYYKVFKKNIFQDIVKNKL